jgi:hypothetical protein
MPLGTWMYVKGESQTWCDGEDPYYQDQGGNTLTVGLESEGDGDDFTLVSIGDPRLSDMECSQNFAFYDASNATAPLGMCGPRVVTLQSWVQLVSPRVLYLRRYFDVDNPYMQDDAIHCRIFESGYLLPLEDVIDSSNPDL